MSKWDFQTITGLKLQLRVLVLVFNVSEFISGLTGVPLSRNLKKESMHQQTFLSRLHLIMIYFYFFPNCFFQNSSCQTQGAAYLRMRLIRRCGTLLFWVCYERTYPKLANAHNEMFDFSRLVKNSQQGGRRTSYFRNL